MKVLYFHQHFTTPQQAGGTRSYELAQRLIHRGHRITMVCGEITKYNLPPSKAKNIKRGNIDGIDVIQILLPYSNNDGIFKRAITFIKFALKGIKIAMNEDYDLVFATSTPLTAGIPGIIAKLFRRKKFVFEVRDLWPELPKALGLRNPLLLWGMSLLEWLTYHYADACIGLSPGICKGIAKRSQKGKVISMIPNGCDINLFKPGKRENLKLDNIKLTDTVAVFTGAHGQANGLNSILDAAKDLLIKKRYDIKLVFIGTGKLKQKLVDRANNDNLSNCIFLPSMPKNQLNEVIACVDVGLMVLANIPAFYYGTSPNKFFDYIAAGLPVINNYPGWLADIIQENNCGIVIPPDNPNYFAGALIEIADNKTGRESFKFNARKLAEKEFDRVILGNKFVDFIETLTPIH